MVSEALEWVEQARGELYSFHQLMGHADELLGAACDKLRAAGHDRSVFREHEQKLRDELQGGSRHVLEAEMKERRRTIGRHGHEARPQATRSIVADSFSI